MNVIYLLRNKVNRKIYIGQTINLKARMANHKSAKSPYPIGSAIRKYGWDNFELEIVELTKERGKLDEKEAFWISHFNSTDKKIGYNLVDRSITMWGHHISEETKRKIGEANKKRMSIPENNPFYGKHHLPETLEKIQRTKEKNKSYERVSKCLKGKKRDPDIIRRALQTKKEKDSYKDKKRVVVQIDKKSLLYIAEYESIKLASEKTGCCRPDITNVCKGKVKSSKGYIWKYKEDYYG